MYFGIHGKAEPIRMLLHQAGVDYEDRRLERDEFAAMKESGELPAGQVPLYIEKSGRNINQANAILRFLGRQHGFYFGDDIDESFYVDWSLEASLDLWSTKAYRRWMAEDEDEEADAQAIAEFAKFNQ